MKKSWLVASAFLVAVLAGCSQEKKVETIAPFALTETAMGRYCGMNVLEHPGPKGQIILAPANEAVWFSSARDTLAFTMLPEEPKTIAAIYVSDMGKAPSWEEPGRKTGSMRARRFRDRKRRAWRYGRKGSRSVLDAGSR